MKEIFRFYRNVSVAALPPNVHYGGIFSSVAHLSEYFRTHWFLLVYKNKQLNFFSKFFVIIRNLSR